MGGRVSFKISSRCLFRYIYGMIDKKCSLQSSGHFVSFQKTCTGLLLVYTSPKASKPKP